MEKIGLFGRYTNTYKNTKVFYNNVEVGFLNNEEKLVLNDSSDALKIKEELNKPISMSIEVLEREVI